MYYVYIAELINDSLYTGFTSNIKERIKRHQRKNSTATTRKNAYKRLLFLAGFTDKKKALDFEKYLKSSSGFAFRNKRLI